MTTYYYEVKHEYQGRKPGVYKNQTMHLVGGSDINLLYHADRIWKQDENGNVEYTKNRHLVTPKVDLEEFTWVVLQAKQL